MVKVKKGWEVRLIFILVLGLAGTLATGRFEIGFIGLGIGIIAVLFEHFLVKTSADKLIYTTIGSIVGLVFGILFLLVLKIGTFADAKQAEWANLLILVPIAFAYVFAVVAVTKGRKLGLVQFEEEEEKINWNMPVLVDLSAAVDGRVADLSLVGLLPGPFTIPLSVKNSIDSMQKSKNAVKRGRARRATETIQRLEEAVGKSGGLIDFHDFGEGERERHRLLEWLRKEKVCLLTSDTQIGEKAEREGIRVINLTEVGPASKEVVLPGESFKTRIQKKGRNASQGIGFLSDGTMVVVDDAGDSIGKEVLVSAHTTFRAKGGTMVFGKVAQEVEDENDK